MHPNLAKYRAERGLTQQQAADLLGVSRPHYALIEVERKRPSVELAKKIGSLYGFAWASFFE